MEKRRQYEAEEKAAREIEGKIESFQQDVDDLRKRRATLEEELREKQRESETELQQLQIVQQQVDEGNTAVRRLEMSVESQSAQIAAKKAILAEHEARAKAMQQEKVKMS